MNFLSPQAIEGVQVYAVGITDTTLAPITRPALRTVLHNISPFVMRHASATLEFVVLSPFRILSTCNLKSAISTVESSHRHSFEVAIQLRAANTQLPPLA